ncbi:MAG: 4Fe-4S binding protein [Pirellulaceae bacterium]|nr:4Fe-4S binding protein [Pirellulaceae bacterium]
MAEDHPTVIALRKQPVVPRATRIPADELREICLNAGAADVGFVGLQRVELDDEREDILRLFPEVKSLICFVCRMNPDSVRSPARNVANHEFHETGDAINDVSRRVVTELSARGIRAVNPPMAFPMEMDRFPGKMWSISLKPLAVAAGLGQMGLHRNVIHPKFGSFILLGTVLIDVEVAEEGTPVDFNPCVNCKLCVAACPVGAISPDGEFNFSSCYSHNYREFMSGFTDWVEAIAGSSSPVAYRQKVTDNESVSMWQSLAYGPGYKAAYCLSVCPAGEDVLKPFLENRAGFLTQIVKPLQSKIEPVYVQPRSDAEAYVRKRFPHKHVRYVGAVLRPTSTRLFIKLMRHGFQPGKAKGLSARYHFRFTGAEAAACTVEIKAEKIYVTEGLVGQPDLRITATSRGWLRLLRKEASIGWLLLTLQIRVRGNPLLLAAFGRCFP